MTILTFVKAFCAARINFTGIVFRGIENSNATLPVANDRSSTIILVLLPRYVHLTPRINKIYGFIAIKSVKLLASAFTQRITI